MSVPTTSSAFNRAIREAGRGKTYSQSRHKIANLLVSPPHHHAVRLNAFLEKELFRIDEKRNWIALAFNIEDWRVIEILRRTRSEQLDRNYLYFLRCYIVENAKRITALHARSQIISAAIMDDKGELISDELAAFDPEDQQSLFSFKTFCAQFARKGDDLKDYFNAILRTDWLRKRFLYPLVYHAINNPGERYFDTFLSYVMTGREQVGERATIKYLLRDDLCRNDSLSFKAYAALLSHPYDACEMLLNHIELEFAAHGKISIELEDALASIFKAVQTPRIAALSDLVLGQTKSFSSMPTGSALDSRYGFSQPIKTFLVNFCVTSPDRSSSVEGLPRALAALERMRSQRYPNPEDFDHLTLLSDKWRFSDAGRLISALLTSLYMVPRVDVVHEARDVLRLIMFFGEVCPFMIASPSGTFLLHWAAAPDGASIELTTDSHIDKGVNYSDRAWIKAVHWSLREPQRRGRITEWLAAVRRDIRVKPSFLSGIDWTWVDAVLRDMRLKPFANPNGAFTLLLLQVEQNDRDPTALRAAIEQSVKATSISELVDWLISEYADEAIAFVRYFLTPDIIMLIGLAANETAAVAGRVFALEACVEKFGFTDLLTVELFEQESQALTATLQLMNVNSGQFEIPWGLFRRDLLVSHGDLFATVTTLSTQHNALSLLSAGRATTPHRYRNGKIVKYTLQQLQWPLASLAIAIIEDFLQHQSFGLEVLLSTRFRHDTLKREINRVIVETSASSITGVPTASATYLIERMAASVPAAVDSWLDRRMHTQRENRPDGLFDLAPSQEDLSQMVEQLAGLTKFEDIIDRVNSWIRSRLDQQLVRARAIFDTEFWEALQESISSQNSALLFYTRPQDIPRVLAALSDGLARETTRLCDWFRGSVAEDRQPLTFRELKLATDGLFETAIAQKKFRAQIVSGTNAERQIASDKVRLCFDVLRNLFSNAQGHSGLGATRVRIKACDRDGLSGFLFSNLASPIEVPKITRVDGERYKSATEAIRREGNSGLPKIAAIAATLIDKDATLVAYRRRRSFHVFIPIWAGPCL